MPPPISSQSDRSRLDASASLENHTSGAETTRPTDCERFSFAHQSTQAISHDFPDLGHLVRSRVSHVDVRRLQPLRLKKR
jgi:hypothetical protein